MAIITSLKQQKNKNRVNVYLDDVFGFGLDLDNFVILSLKIGQELTEEEIEKIVKKAEFQKTLDKLLRFAMVRLRSEKEYKAWLYRKKVPDVIHKDLFLRLKNLDLIDDIKFAEMWIENRKLLNPKSKRVIVNELRIKGIEKQIIEKVLNENVIDEEKIALDLLKSRESHWKRIEGAKRKNKMMEYLVRKGFDFSLARNVISAYNIEEDDRVKDSN